MELIKMSEAETKNHVVGAAITLTGVMAILTIAIMAVIAYKIFTSNKGKTSIPGGFKFEWN